MINRPLFLILAVFIAACAAPVSVFISPNYKPGEIGTVAILGFKDYPGSAGSGQMVSQIFQTYLLSLGYNVIERQQVQSVLREQSFDLSGNVNLSSIVSAGKLLGADELVLGDITDFKDSSEQTVMVDVPTEHSRPIFGPVGKGFGIVGMNVWQSNNVVPQTQTIPAKVGLSARMTGVKTGEILWSGTASADGGSLSAASQNVSRRLIMALADKIESQRP
ncbi:MAG: CsgG/HfaB family protein [Elusimicrobiota bacterium]